MRLSLKTSTALIASLALAMPGTLPAQGLGEAVPEFECPEGTSEADCLLLGEQAAADAAAAAEAAAEAEAAVEAEAAAEAEAQAAAEAEAAAQAELEAAAEEAEAAAAEAEAQTETQTEAEAEAEAETEAAAETDATADAPAADTETAVETEAAAEGDATSETETPAPEGTAETEAEATVETEAEAATGEAATPPAETTDTAETQDAEGTETEMTEAGSTETATSETATAEADAAATEEETQAPLAALGAEGEAEAEVTTETVTEENSRSSSEDFEQSASGEATAEAGAETTAAPAAGNDDDGLSNLERALLIGAGAIFVGSILNGNREVVSQTDDRVVVQRSDGSYEILKDDNALLRQPGSEVQTQTFSDGSTLTTVTRPDGFQVITVRDAELRVVRRVSIAPDGTETVLIDDTNRAEPVDVTTLPAPIETTTDGDLRAALERQALIDRRFSLAQVRDIREVRLLAPAIDLDNITFETGSAAISPSQAEELTMIGRLLSDMIDENPGEIFLIEGHTDAVGGAAMNLTLSDRRAESVALALSEYFDVPPENLVVQGYGESNLRVQTDGPERANRRAVVRRITPLLQVAAAQ
ncbi:OmpA family protein [Rhodophyticola sp.]|jgi:outer membrane protein OmpA-like peptidoglycan-associated protein|uniref:OmpA family protein n=1 Tax=Rhodophyticola sp. TaxID=2680032 RepID=UPI003D2BC48E